MTDDPVPSSSGESPIGEQQAYELQRMLFDLAYLTMNADGTEHLSEKTLVRELQRRIDAVGDVDFEERTEDLQSVVEQGPEYVHRRVLYLADAVRHSAGDDAETITHRYLDLLRDLIIADVDVDPEERRIFNALCDRWNIDAALPGNAPS